MTPNPRNFQQELNEKISEQPIPLTLFEGTTHFQTLDSLCETIVKALYKLKITEFPLKSFIDVVGIVNQKQVDLNLMSLTPIINLIPRLTAYELGLSIHDFILLQTDNSIVIKNWNDAVAPLKAETERQAKLYEVKLNGKGK